MSSGTRFWGLVSLVSIALTGRTWAQPAPGKYVRRPMPGVVCTAPPVIDGDLSDGAWTTAGRAEEFVDRANGNVVGDQTVAFITYDQKHIYVAYECFDSEPDKIEARETIRDSKYANRSDESPNKEDNVTFSIDPYFSKKPEDVSVFSVNANGTPSAQIAGGRGGKLEWKGHWDAAAKRTPKGYTVEMRIPWVILNYPSSSKPATMGVNFFRYQYHTRTETVWSNVTNRGFTDLEGVWSDIQAPKSGFRPKISLLPYVLPGIKDGEFTFRSGLDARMTVTPDLTAVGSLNPDFNTIEGAVESIQFSRAERFIQEKRPFFLEGQNFLAPGTRFNDIGAYLYSRRIPTFDLGTKVYGKITPVDSVGFLNTVTFGERTDTAFRYRRDLSPTSDAGVFIGQRQMAGDHNTVAMIDQHARFGKVGLESQFAKTWGDNAGGGAVVLSANYQDLRNISVFQYHTISEDFQIANGFIPYTNYHGFFGFTDFFGPWRTGPWSEYDYGVYGIGWDHQDGSRYQRGFGAFGSLTSRSDWRFGFSQDYAVIDGTIDSTYMVSATMGASNRFRKVGIGVTVGRLAGEPSTYLTPSASVRLFRHLDLAYSGALLNFQGTTRQHVLNAGYELSPTRSFGGRMVALDADTNWYLYFRSAGGRGTDLYFIYGDPNTRTFARKFQVKLVFAI